MIQRLAKAVVNTPLLALIAVGLLIFAGVKGYQELPIDAVPDVTNVQVQVLTTAAGLSPVEVERMVTQPVELAMTGIPGMTRIRSTSRAGVSAVTLLFDERTDLYMARQLVSQRLQNAREAIPSDAGRPELGPLTTGLGEVYHFTVEWPGHSSGEIRALLDWDIAYRLRSVRGVVEVNAWGGDSRQVEVRLRDSALLASRVTPLMVEAALLASGTNVSGGSIENGEEGTFVRTEAAYQSLSDIANQVVAVNGPAGTGRPILVGDVAEVVNGAAPRFSGATADAAGETVYGMVQMVAGGNAHRVVADVKEKLAEIQRSLPADVKIKPFYDRAAFVDRVLNTVRKNLLEGGLVVALVLLVMLGNLRAGLVVASVIPLSMLGAFACMNYFGIGGNLLSLGAIDFGLVVDGAVVVVEGTLSAMVARKLSARDAMLQVAGEVGRPVTMAVVIIAVVYVPVLMLEGVEGKMFRPMALTVLFAMATALVLTFVWVPAVGSLVLRRVHAEPRFLGWLRERYLRLLDRLRNRWAVAAAGLGVLVLLAGVAASTRGAEFVPRLEEGDIAIQVTRPPSVSLSEAVQGATDVERALRRFPDVERVVTRIGSPDVATDVMGIEQSDVFAILKPREQWTLAKDAAGFATAFAPALERALPGASFGFTQPIEMRVQELIGGVRSDVGIKIFGTDLTVLRGLAEDLARVTGGVPGAADVRVEPTRGLRMLSIRPDPVRAGRLGVRSEELLAFTQLLRNGRVAGRFIDGERRFPIVERLHGQPPADEDTLRALRVPLADGRSVLLSDIATTTLSDAPAQVSREQGRRRVLVEANVRGTDLASFVQELTRRLAKVKLPDGYYYELGGQYENLSRAMQRFALIVPLTLLVVFSLLYLAFDALRPALLVFVNIPAAATGGIIALSLRGLDLSVSAAVGFLALFGVATLNGVVLVAAIRARQRTGEARERAVYEAAGERLRPVLTTALVAALGFLPMAIATGVGAEVQRPLATVVIGGLITSTLATLIALPALFARFGGEVAAEEGSPSPHLAE